MGSRHRRLDPAEGYVSQLKRWIDGTHHHVSARHLSRCRAEFDFRYHTRKETHSDRTKQPIQKDRGKRLVYENGLQPKDLK